MLSMTCFHGTLGMVLHFFLPSKPSFTNIVPHSGSYLLLHCDEAMSFPLWVTSSKGDPDAKMARPPVHLWAVSAEHSDLEVGLDSGKMTGGLSDWFNSVNTSSLKMPPQPLKPISTLGRT